MTLGLNLLFLVCVLSVASSNTTVRPQDARKPPGNDRTLITIGGAVSQPQKVELRRTAISLFELIAASGGIITERAKGTVEVVRRRTNEGSSAVSAYTQPEIYELKLLYIEVAMDQVHL